MSTQGKIKTLYSDREQTEAIFPRTTTNAIFDEDGVGLEAILSTAVHAKEEFENNSEVTLNDADTFGGNTPDYFASAEDLQEINSRIDSLVFPVKSVNLKTGNVTLTAADVGAVTEAFVKNEIANAKLDNSESGVDLSGYVTKDEFQAIDFPVDSVNGKTGEITLTAADIGALNLLNITDDAHKVPEGADLNTYTTPGAYRIATAAIMASLTNAPSYTTTGGRLIVSGLSGTSGVIQLIIFNTTNTQIQIRIQNYQGTWGEWKKIYTQLDTIPIENGGTGATDAPTARTNLGITPANIGAAASSHGNHVPTKQTASNKVFLRNDNTWQTVTPANIGAVPTGFTSDVSGAVQFRKSNGMVYVCTPTRYAVIGSITIPSGYRPAVNTVVQGLWLPRDYSINNACVEFKTNGTITVQTGVSQTLNGNDHGWFSVNCCYPAAT